MLAAVMIDEDPFDDEECEEEKSRSPKKFGCIPINPLKERKKIKNNFP
jgi:hypothetical protein